MGWVTGPLAALRMSVDSVRRELYPCMLFLAPCDGPRPCTFVGTGQGHVRCGRTVRTATDLCSPTAERRGPRARVSAVVRCGAGQDPRRDTSRDVARDGPQRDITQRCKVRRRW